VHAKGIDFGHDKKINEMAWRGVSCSSHKRAREQIGWWPD
jgi:hypothetical protein